MPEMNTTYKPLDGFRGSVRVDSFIEKPSKVAANHLRNIIIQKKLGTGAYGEVFLGDWNGTPVALKNVTKRGQKFISEVDTLSHLNHPNIVRFLGIFINSSNENFIVTEYCKQGSLIDTLKSKKLGLYQLISIAVDSAKGMVYLEDNEVLHRDLAARNILLDDMEHIKIGDFGLSVKGFTQIVDDDIPFRWSAPEVLQNGKFTSKADVWSFGVVLWEMYSGGQLPYSSYQNNTEIVSAITGGIHLPRSTTTPDAVWKLMTDCWNRNPNDRPKFGTILRSLKDIQTVTKR